MTFYQSLACFCLANDIQPEVDSFFDKWTVEKIQTLQEKVLDDGNFFKEDIELEDFLNNLKEC